jgi:hypothetical protein
MSAAIAVDELPRRAERGHGEAGSDQRRRQRIANRIVVVDDEDRRPSR